MFSYSVFDTFRCSTLDPRESHVTQDDFSNKNLVFVGCEGHG